MNNVSIMGRLTADPVLRITQSGHEYSFFTIAIRRNFKASSGDYQTDYVPCVAWGQRAEILTQHFAKGSRIGAVGNIQTRIQQTANLTRTVVEVLVTEIQFVDTKAEAKQAGSITAPSTQPATEFEIHMDDSELPWDIGLEPEEI